MKNKDRLVEIIHMGGSGHPPENFRGCTHFDCVMLRSVFAENVTLREALKELLAIAKHYKPISKGYNPEDEDEEMWAIGGLYSRIEKELSNG